jgi:hypothetical protein
LAAHSAAHLARHRRCCGRSRVVAAGSPGGGQLQVSGPQVHIPEELGRSQHCTASPSSPNHCTEVLGRSRRWIGMGYSTAHFRTTRAAQTDRSGHTGRLEVRCTSRARMPGYSGR